MLVIDELFPLQSTTIVEENPIIFVTFLKNLTTLDYILGDPMQREAEMAAQAAAAKEEMEREEKRKKDENIRIKNRDMMRMKNITIQAKNSQKATFGAISTLMFVQFAVQHVFLALRQYQVGNMCELNYAITRSLLPGLDVNLPLTPRQFVTRYELEDYLLVDVNSLFRTASENI